MAAAAAPRPRVMVLPFPAQGHVMPLMALALRLVEHGIEVDFLNTEFNQDRVLKALAAGEADACRAAGPAGINMVSLLDGMDHDGDHTDIGKLGAGLPAAMLGRKCNKEGDSRRVIIQTVIKTVPKIKLAETIVCNTFEEIESEALALFPKPALAVSPLEMPASTPSAACHFWPEDQACLAWLDTQAPGFVVYVAFGSLTVFDAARLQELADGLLLTGRRFLWVVRPNLADGVAGEGWFDELKRRAGGAGMVVGWTPQQRVLSHPSVACFVTHCGWNSTMEAVSKGVPMLCWPYFADQFMNQSYVCDVWGTGLRVCADERVLVNKEEITDKVARLLGDEGIKARVMSWKKAACASVADGGSSHRDLLELVNLLSEQ